MNIRDRCPRSSHQVGRPGGNLRFHFSQERARSPLVCSRTAATSLSPLQQASAISGHRARRGPRRENSTLSRALPARTGFRVDVGDFTAWAQWLASLGPGGFYAPGYFSDYPPGYLYVLWLLGSNRQLRRRPGRPRGRDRWLGRRSRRSLQPGPGMRPTAL